MTFIPAAFPKIPAYRREADPVHHARRVVCLEKIDGANTRVGVPRGALGAEAFVIGGRALLEGDRDFCQPALRQSLCDDAARVRALLSLASELPGDLVLYGETCGRGIQSTGFLYGPRVHLVLFAATVGGAWVSLTRPLDLVADDGAVRRVPSLRELGERARLPVAPCLYEGPPDAERFDALLDRPSEHASSRGAAPAQADTTHEGVVIWSDPVLLDGAGRLLVAKHKHPRRRESPDAPEGLETAAAFAARVVTVERARHALQHLQESGRGGATGEALASLLARRVVQDVAREELTYHAVLARHGKVAVRAALEAAVRALDVDAR
ncbi:MAG: RNA ligase family protein [Polyangiales bacterium]